MKLLISLKKWLFFATLVYISLSSTWIYAWDGFDADTADLVEIIPDKLPKVGETVDVHNFDRDEMIVAIVDGVIRNARTVEIFVYFPDGKRHTLVMERR